MIIEDQLIPAFDMRSQLHELGYTVTGIFTTAEEALEFLERNRDNELFPEVIITDFALAGKMNGLEVSRRINQKYDCGIIFSTGLYNMPLIEEVLQSHPALFILKPFDIYHTHVCIQMAIYQRRLEMENRSLKEQYGKSE